MEHKLAGSIQSDKQRGSVSPGGHRAGDVSGESHSGDGTGRRLRPGLKTAESVRLAFTAESVSEGFCRMSQIIVTTT